MYALVDASDLLVEMSYLIEHNQVLVNNFVNSYKAVEFVMADPKRRPVLWHTLLSTN